MHLPAWLNNCVGHFNHRHFYLYMVYMTIGTVFIMSLGFEIAYKEVWIGGADGVGLSGAWDLFIGRATVLEEEVEQPEGYPVRVNGTHLMPIVSKVLFSLLRKMRTKSKELLT